jgi:hypothetical protein
MTTFPALIPSTRTYSPGEYPITPHPLLSGSEIRVRHSNTVLGARLRLTFQAASSADVVAVRNHYNGRQGGFLPFAIPVELLSGVTTPADFTPSGHQWVYASRPSVVDVPIAGDTPTNRHDLVVELVTVPPENTIVAGARITVRATVRGGSAQLGAYIESFASVVGGAASAVITNEAEGAAITADVSVDGGAASAVTPDPDFASVSLLLPCNGTNGSTTFTDASSSALTVTPTGNAQISTAQSKWGGSSALFDGTGDYLSTTLGSSIGTGDFTAEAWVYINAFPGFVPIIQIGDSFLSSGLILSPSSTGRIAIGGNNGGFITGTTETVSISTWTHLAVTRQGTTLRAFVDGVLDGSTTHSFSLAATVRIGAELYNGGLGGQANAYVDDVRITTGVARYTASFTPPSGPFATS